MDNYQTHSFREESYSSAEVQLVYLTTPADWVVRWLHQETLTQCHHYPNLVILPLAMGK